MHGWQNSSIDIAFYVILRYNLNSITNHYGIFSEHDTLRLSIEAVRKLDREMNRSYPSWLADIPLQFHDPFFTYGQPITISYSYGQNVRLKWTEAQSQAHTFDQAHNFKYVRSIDVALASHPT